MLDAFGRIPPAITQGNDADMGNYDQCINIYEKLEDVDIYGRYCYSGLIVPISIDAIDISSINLTEEVCSLVLQNAIFYIDKWLLT